MPTVPHNHRFRWLTKVGRFQNWYCTVEGCLAHGSKFYPKDLERMYDAAAHEAEATEAIWQIVLGACPLEAAVPHSQPGPQPAGDPNDAAP